ncbi:MAG: hypothetical protein ACLR5H_02935 [Oscillospiraceae bacterium]
MKTKQIITVCLLAAFLAGFGLWGLLRTPGDVSQAERRPWPSGRSLPSPASCPASMPASWRTPPPTSSPAGAVPYPALPGVL